MNVIILKDYFKVMLSQFNYSLNVIVQCKFLKVTCKMLPIVKLRAKCTLPYNLSVIAGKVTCKTVPIAKLSARCTLLYHICIA